MFYIKIVVEFELLHFHVHIIIHVSHTLTKYYKPIYNINKD